MPIITVKLQDTFTNFNKLVRDKAIAKGVITAYTPIRLLWKRSQIESTNYDDLKTKIIYEPTIDLVIENDELQGGSKRRSKKSKTSKKSSKKSALPMVGGAKRISSKKTKRTSRKSSRRSSKKTKITSRKSSKRTSRK